MSQYIDLLYEDPLIQNQKYVCLSFLSPEKIIKEKDLYKFEKFLNNWDLNKRLEIMDNFTKFICYKHKLNYENMQRDLKDFIKDIELKIKDEGVSDDYHNFINTNEEKLEEEFNKLNNFTTSTRGIKIRGTFNSQEEAELRCKLLRELDSSHDVFVGEVGKWMPWDPDAYKTNRVEHLEEELNNLMHEKMKNEDKAKLEFEKRVNDAKKEAIEKNIKLAKEHGNKLTQNIDESCNLININEDSTVSVSDIEKKLFDDTDVRLKNDTEIKMKT